MLRTLLHIVTEPFLPTQSCAILLALRRINSLERFLSIQIRHFEKARALYQKDFGVDLVNRGIDSAIRSNLGNLGLLREDLVEQARHCGIAESRIDRTLC